VTRGAVGTPAYMAPEQARDTRQASMASDVFSLGATLLYAVTGHAPYGGETVMDVLVRLATEAPDLTGVPDDLAGLVTACLERSPRDRPTSSAVLEQLEPYVSQTPAPGTEHPYLSPPAVALITDYQRGPQATAIVRSTSGPRPKMSLPPSGIPTASPDGVLIRAVTEVVGCAIAFLPDKGTAQAGVVWVWPAV
jgi:serine/threonine protein kinase